MYRALLKSLKDIASPEILGFILKSGLGAIAGWSIFLWLFWDQFSALVAAWISKIPYVGSMGFLQDTGALIAALLCGYALVIITVSIIASLFGEKIIASLAAKQYPDVQIRREGKLHRSIYYTVKASILFAILFIFSLPLLFVPIVGQIVVLFLWSILLKTPTVYDVSSVFGKKHSDFGGPGVWAIALIAASFNYIPLLNIFAPIFAQILFMHYILGKEKTNRMR